MRNAKQFWPELPYVCAAGVKGSPRGLLSQSMVFYLRKTFTSRDLNLHSIGQNYFSCTSPLPAARRLVGWAQCWGNHFGFCLQERRRNGHGQEAGVAALGERIERQKLKCHDNMIIYIENFKDSTEKLLELIGEISMYALIRLVYKN